MSDQLEPYVSHVCRARKQEILKGEWFEKTVPMPFEGHSFQVPENYDAVLKVFFGDYMTLPPENKRVPHHVYDVWYRDEEK